MKDFPKPDCGVLTAPKLDEQVKEHLKMKGKDPHFGSEKSLYKLQAQLVNVAGPLTCLWADLLNKEARVSAEDTLLLMQRALVLLGSASHAISQERRKIAWTRINPKLKSLASEDYDKRETNLFGPGFLEKASKRIEVDKTMEKVATPSHKGGPSYKRARYENDKSDLRSFFIQMRPCKVRRQEIPAPTVVLPSEQVPVQQEVLSEEQTHLRTDKTRQAQTIPVNSQCTHLSTLGLTLTLPVHSIESLPPAGCLKHCHINWIKITSDNWVLQSIRGYQLELMRAQSRQNLQGSSRCRTWLEHRWTQRWRNWSKKEQCEWWMLCPISLSATYLLCRRRMAHSGRWSTSNH